MNTWSQIDEILTKVTKPVRYMGGEYGSAEKDPRAVDVRFAFLFPDVYEVGMSHLGMKILYHSLNKRTDTYCERVFSPWVDMEALLKESGVPLFSLETRTPLSEFDILGITLQYEMSYTNILSALALSGIPLLREERKSGPFVVLGGPCAFNPEPLADFADLIVLGDGEEVIHQLVDAYKAHKEENLPRDAFLVRAAKIDGVYVPSLYDVSYNPDGSIKGIAPKPGSGAKYPVMKALANDLSALDFPDKLIVPFGDAVHNRIMLEIFRGCTRGCRFCQAGMIYRPVRERPLSQLLELAEKLVDATGFDEISLMSLSSGDYSCLPELAKELVSRFLEKRVKISLPSMRIDSLIKDTLKETQKVRKSALTLAPEAGTQRLRDVINKGVTEEDLLRSVRDAFSEGWSAVKLYFMIGLPTETDEDIDGIADLAKKVAACYFERPKAERAPGLRITVSTSVFVPKPHTPFQWCGQLNRQVVMERQARLKSLLNSIKGVDFKYHAPDLSFVEAVFSRGDRRLSKVLIKAYEKGLRMDGWSEHFHFGKWMEAFSEEGIDPAGYAEREIALHECLPWDHLDAGVEKTFLLSEWQKAKKAEITKDCREGCVGCGLLRYSGACV